MADVRTFYFAKVNLYRHRSDADPRKRAVEHRGEFTGRQEVGQGKDRLLELIISTDDARCDMLSSHAKPRAGSAFSVGLRKTLSYLLTAARDGLTTATPVIASSAAARRRHDTPGFPRRPSNDEPTGGLSCRIRTQSGTDWVEITQRDVSLIIRVRVCAVNSSVYPKMQRRHKRRRGAFAIASCILLT